MTFALWLTFTLAAGTLIAIPGPTNVMVMACGLRHGTKPALSTVFGIVPGVMAAMLLSFLGLGAVLATSAHLFDLMKWAGAIYLVYLGIKQWRSAPALAEVTLESPQGSSLAIIGQAFMVTFLNPKGIIFYIAFMPQFIAPTAPVLPQMLLLGATFIVLIFPINTAYALLAGKMRTLIQNRRTLRLMNRTGGAMLIGAGILTASLKRA
jgi:threonine/homoserine/homoserine lactone efflux protein